MGNVILKCTNLSKTYDFDNALNNVNLSIESGKIIGLLGPNGKWKNNFYKAVKWTSKTYRRRNFYRWEKSRSRN